MPTIETVLGPITADSLGITLSHEHLFINLMRERRGDGLLNDEDLMVDEVGVFAEQGGGTIVELSSGELTAGSTVGSEGGTRSGTRDRANVEAIGRLSRRTGVNVVLGTGHYRDPFLDPDYFDSHSVDEIAAELIRDLEHGIPGADVRAGVIGEIGSDKWFISAREERSFRAAARASNRTNAAIYTHAARWPVGIAQLDLLCEEGIDLSRVAVGHLDTVPDPDYAITLAKRGVFLGIDTMYQDTPRAVSQRVDLVLALVTAGYSERILLSQDVCVGSQLRSAGGPGFGHILGAFKTAILEAGLNEDQFTSIVTDNPAHFLAG